MQELFKYEENRKTERLKAFGKFSGKIILEDHHMAIACKLINYSVHGMSLAIAKELIPGTRCRLIYECYVLTCEIVWARNNIFGVKCLDNHLNLNIVFEEFELRQAMEEI